ncbi:FadR/GntR family transcriptional regulator [Chelatococcus asaccharovorans]|uniref:GntR family transcriptional regulator n=1 Tax=Chelatococcus asaccharovorans TaxID=28210 RepID=A0A2V3UES2_9HYPH|nr:FadR/GntR family transcriptional regulator [Chelatococcus asaccharovorans]MBS7707292.1 FadR family transcriptional regulator [Chelatococcus asaccharovorans]PXW63474.1 GntR family transcriptional regulator [Chelatococcus asaccharovorans]CAH1651192.1 GntR family transcriptional regulator [Chelatococcus asaccharovorans]CAH1692783.1 GntR family transcriptional regulator [Chelatococcus asaccharovorans]
MVAARISDRRRLSSIVAQEITKWIINGTLKAGDALPPEAEICRQFNVSKPTAREAIDNLSVMGIVKVQQGKQTTVNPLNSLVLEDFFRYAVQTYPEGLYDIVELRRGLETEAAALAAERITDDEAQLLKALTERLRAGLYSPAEWLSTDYEFHAAIVRASKNKLILQTFNGISEHVRYVQRVCHMQRDMRVPDYNMRLHEKIAEAIIAGDPGRTRTLMFEHFGYVLPFVAAIVNDKSRLSEIF